MANTKEVRFDVYCPKCKHAEEKESFNCCNECLAVPAREYSIRPENWEEKK